MKRLILILLSTGILQANAQKLDSILLNTQLFVKLGVTQNNLFNHSLFNQSLVGLEMGAHLQTKWKPSFYTEIGLNYVRKGSAREIIYTNAVNEKILSYTENLYLHYAQLPLVLYWQLPLKHKVKVSIGAGFYNAWLFSAWVNPQHYYLNHEQGNSYNVYDNGIIGCVKIMYNNKIGVAARFENGLQNVTTNNGGLNNSYALTFSYAIKRLKK